MINKDLADNNLLLNQREADPSPCTSCPAKCTLGWTSKPNLAVQQTEWLTDLSPQQNLLMSQSLARIGLGMFGAPLLMLIIAVWLGDWFLSGPGVANVGAIAPLLTLVGVACALSLVAFVMVRWGTKLLSRLQVQILAIQTKN